MEFTPKQLHYFKRELITDQLNHEIATLLQNPDALLDKEKVDSPYPLIDYMFHNMVIQFPLLKQVEQDEFWPKCKILLNEFNKAQLENFYCPQHTKSSMQRKHIQRKIKRSLVFAYCASVRLEEGQEESIRISETSPSVVCYPQIRIVGVRQVEEKKASLYKVKHAEFIVESHFPDIVYVAKRHKDFKLLHQRLRRHFPTIPPVPHKYHAEEDEKLYKERDRVALDGFLHQLLKQPQLAQHDLFRQFLTDQPIQFVPQRDREEADRLRQQEREQYQKEMDERVKNLHQTLEDLKKEIIRPNGLIDTFDIIKNTSKIEDLPPSLLKAFEWGRINFAFALHKQFVTHDSAAENLNTLKRTHSMLPYRTLAMILKISNPLFMVKGVLDLFLAQPFGSKSLFQRMLLSNMSEESKSFRKSIEQIEKRVNNERMCEKIANAVSTRRELDKKDYRSSTVEIMALLENKEVKPVLSQSELSPLLQDNEESKVLIKELYRLWDLHSLLKEQEVMADLVFQGVTGELLKEFIAVFYQPLAQVYRAADISTSIRHVAAFIDDLLLTMNPQDERHSIESLILLVKRHEQKFYDFVYKVHTQEASHVFDDLIRYVDRLFTFMTVGLQGKVNMNACVQETGIETEEARTQLKMEIDSLCHYRYQQKIYRFQKTKAKMMVHSDLASMDRIQDVNDEAFHFMPAFEDLNDEDEVDDSSSDSQPSSLHTITTDNSSNGDIDPPLLLLIPKITKHFIQHTLKLMVGSPAVGA
ncbi:hypothetical protein BY458DRAFT_508373 [Sporodiniella umbellata]|nr:hypothetical protein BY458DRAFT_508373 [Sporodiniella umbellata]